MKKKRYICGKPGMMAVKKKKKKSWQNMQSQEKRDARHTSSKAIY